jgi:hypothetical protein
VFDWHWFLDFSNVEFLMDHRNLFMDFIDLHCVLGHLLNLLLDLEVFNLHCSIYLLYIQLCVDYRS